MKPHIKENIVIPQIEQGLLPYKAYLSLAAMTHPSIIPASTLIKTHAGTPPSVPAHHMSPHRTAGHETALHNLSTSTSSPRTISGRDPGITAAPSPSLPAPHTGLGLHDSSCRRLPECEWPGDKAVRCLKAGCLQEAAGTVVALLVFRDSLPAYS